MTSTDIFLANLQQRYRLSDGERQFLGQRMQRKRLVALQRLHEVGQVPDRAYFLYEGVMRGCRNDLAAQAGEERLASTWFCHRQGLVGNIQDVVLGRRLHEHIEASTPCTLYYLTKEDISLFMARYANVSPLYNRLIRGYIRLLTRRSECTAPLRGEERVQRFMELLPHCIHRLPQGHVASYLGMSRETLNRIIRKK